MPGHQSSPHSATHSPDKTNSAYTEVVIALNSHAGGARLLALGAGLVLLTLGACGNPATRPLGAGGASATMSHQPSSNEPVPSPSAVGGSGTSSGRPPTNLPIPSHGFPPVNPVQLPSTDPEVVSLLNGLPATIAGHTKTLNTPHQIRYADGSWITVQPLVEAVGNTGMTTNDLFKRLTNRGQYQVNAQNAPGARLLWFTGKTRIPFVPTGNAKPPPFNRYAAVVADSGGEWIFYVTAGDAGTLTELMRSLRLTTT
jgi:hypothetical protein